MPYVPSEKQCAWCGRTWMAARPKARTCSPSCRARLTASEKGNAAPEAAPIQGFEFLDDDDFLTTTETASMLGVTRPTVRDWIDRGRLAATAGGEPGRGRGQLVKVRVGDLRALLARATTRT